ncbi:hypothetical protein [Halovivax gelatinilyticus]|uniref:hypothetical protein n=1 Tax=Halovivax gelatinilyticus TaxID=2961597 RepID=UPI0020CA8F66|nr:hypothetical protein [Halovivax gelatinilyticus]
MIRKIIPKKREGKIAAVLLVIAHVSLAPPIVSAFNTPELVAGFPPLYIWTLLVGSAMAIILLWAAWIDAWGITMEQVPPELREKTGVIGFTDTDRDETTVPESAVVDGGEK